MDIARLLTFENVDDGRGGTRTTTEEKRLDVRSPAIEAPAVMEPSFSPPRTAPTRRPTRRRRKPTVESMRAQVLAYEYVVANLSFVIGEHKHDDESATSSSEEDESIYLCADARRMRDFLRRTVVNSKHIHRECAIRDTLLKMLKRYYDSAANLDKLTMGIVLDDWHWTCERWRTLSLGYYEPLTQSHCYAIVQQTLRAIKSYKLPEGAKKTGSSFFGWRESQTLANDQRFVHFITRKTLRRSDIERCADRTWAIYGNSELYKTYNMGEQCDFFHQVLQRISSDIIVIQTIEKYPAMPKMTHSLCIAFRARTETGYVTVQRNMESPMLQQFMRSEGLSLSGNFYWNALDVEQRDAQGECIAFQGTVAGCIGSDDRAYAQRWNTEIAISLVRAEMQVMGTSIASLESSPVAGGNSEDCEESDER